MIQYSHSQVPFLWATQSIQLVEIGPGEKITAPIRDNLPFSLIRASILRNISQDSTQRLSEFYQCHVTTSQTVEYLLGDELIFLEFTEWETYTQSIPLNEFTTYTGHRHGKRDADGPEHWAELRYFFSTGFVPAKYSTDHEKLRFRKKAQRFFLHNNQLWILSKQKHALPRLVVEDSKRRSELIAMSHTECGHKGSEPTYKNLSDRLYWPNMFDDVSYFVRSCIECQKSIKDLPVIPYNVSWQAPLL